MSEWVCDHIDSCKDCGEVVSNINRRVEELEKENCKILFDVSAQSSAERKDFASKYMKLQALLKEAGEAFEAIQLDHFNPLNNRCRKCSAIIESILAKLREVKA